jgi:hypothetical protein
MTLNEENDLMDISPASPITSVAPVSSRKWYELWRDVWTNPSVETFLSILKDRDHSATRGFIWIGVTSLILGLISALVSIPLLNRISSQVPSFISSGETLLTTLCTIIITPIITIIGMIILTGIYHLIAKLFGGRGNWSDLVFCMAAVTAPASIISTVVSAIWSIFSQVRVLLFLVAILFGIIAITLLIYSIVLYILAIRATENVGTGGAIATVLIPIGVVFVLVFCCIGLLIPAFVISVQH